MKFAALLCAGLLMLNSSNSTLSAEGGTSASLGDLRSWNGRFPYEKQDGRLFFAQPALRSKLVAAVGEAEAKKIVGYSEHGPSTPIALRDGVLITSVCQAHNCGDEHFDIFIDTTKSRVIVCRVTEQLNAKGTVLWSAEGHPKVETKDSCTPEGEPSPSYYQKQLNMIPRSLRD